MIHDRHRRHTERARPHSQLDSSYAVARTAHVAKVPATIFVPKGVSPARVRKIKSWNARSEIVGSVWDEANAAALDHAKSAGSFYLHSFADPLIVAGQGTLGLDILDDLPELDAIIIAIGGGGLIAGLSTAIRTLRPSARIHRRRAGRFADVEGQR
ncbi:MAG: pyridoxal-phosphate dependent enzyme [Parvibaculaceae bacterium]